MKEKFTPILDNGEEIIDLYLPVKKKVYTVNLVITLLLALLVGAFMCVGFFVPEEGAKPLAPIFVLIPIGIVVLAIVLCLFLTKLWLKNTVYAVTNKRIIIRTGVIGVDFKCLDLEYIGATTVYVSLIDKLLGGKTGSIRFGSMSSPINNSSGTTYSFSSVLNPYKTYKNIKEKIEKAKNK